MAKRSMHEVREDLLQLHNGFLRAGKHGAAEACFRLMIGKDFEGWEYGLSEADLSMIQIAIPEVATVLNFDGSDLVYFVYEYLTSDWKGAA